VIAGIAVADIREATAARVATDKAVRPATETLAQDNPARGGAIVCPWVLRIDLIDDAPLASQFGTNPVDLAGETLVGIESGRNDSLILDGRNAEATVRGTPVHRRDSTGLAKAFDRPTEEGVREPHLAAVRIGGLAARIDDKHLPLLAARLRRLRCDELVAARKQETSALERVPVELVQGIDIPRQLVARCLATQGAARQVDDRQADLFDPLDEVFTDALERPSEALLISEIRLPAESDELLCDSRPTIDDPGRRCAERDPVEPDHRVCDIACPCVVLEMDASRGYPQGDHCCLKLCSLWRSVKNLTFTHFDHLRSPTPSDASTPLLEQQGNYEIHKLFATPIWVSVNSDL